MSRLDAVGTFPEVDLVQIHREDFVLGVLVFQLFGQEGFLNFPGQCPLLGQEGVLGQLLRNRTAALHVVPQDVAHEGAQGAAVIDAAMFIEPIVFNGNERIPDLFRNLVELDGNPVFRRCRRVHDFPLAVVELGDGIWYQTIFQGGVGKLRAGQGKERRQ